MKKYRWVLTAVFAAFLVGTSGCGKKTETIPITTISQSTDDDDPEDNLAASGDSDEIPEYDVDLSKNLNSFQLEMCIRDRRRAWVSTSKYSASR